LYGYDNAGNITYKHFALYDEATQELFVAGECFYSYDDPTWGDLLTEYDNCQITYDEIGNPETFGARSYTWEHGRQLKSLTEGTTTWNYTYDAGGMRTGRSNGTATYEYVYNGSQLTQMKKGNDTLTFTYDASGIPLTITHGSNKYYYATNLQGDVVAILDAAGSAVAGYTYDAWGNCTVTGVSSIAELNPLRYRGYVYDTETELYYLQSRYYDPEVGRFINADGLVATSQGFAGNNIFAYCGNNPVNRKDPTGQSWIAMLVVAVVAVCAVAISGCSKQPTSDVGAAQPYVDMPGRNNINDPNCYGYAVGIDVNLQPGQISGREPSDYSNVDDVGASVEADLKKLGYSVRPLDTPNDKVYENEFKIALRVGLQPYDYNKAGDPLYDYHFMVQTSTGAWAEKHGSLRSSQLWDVGMTPDTISWSLPGVSASYYDSEILYYAIGK